MTYEALTDATLTPLTTDPTVPPVQSFARIAYRQLVRNKLAMFGFALVMVVLTIAVLVPFLANDKPYVIHMTMPNDYEAAYYSWLDAHEQVAAILAAGTIDPKRLARNRRVLLANLQRMATQLAAPLPQRIDDYADLYRELLAGPVQAPAAWEALQRDIQAQLAPSRVTLVECNYYPLFRNLRALELFFLVLYGAALLQWLVRNRFAPTWRKAALALLVATAVAVAWTALVPLRTVPTGYFKTVLTDDTFALFPPIPYGETEGIIEEDREPPTWLLPADARTGSYHLLGTDTIGRDVASRMIYGARIAMIVGFVAVTIYVALGILIGSFAGYFRGAADMVISRFIEIVICFPTLFLILIVLAYLRPSIVNIMVVIGLTSWTGVARLTRGEFFRIVTLDYVSAVQALGGSTLRIIFRHILPNGIGPVLVVASFGIASAILVESALSFLGLGVPQPYASWGTLLNEGHANIQGTWWLTVFPGIAIFLTVTAWNLFGEGLRDAIDPRLKQ